MTAPASRSAGESGAPRTPYFVNGWVDFLLIGGASILAFPAAWLWASGPRAVWATSLGGALVWIVNWPHFSATNFRLYRSWANAAQYPVTAAAVPWLVAAGAAASLAWREEFAPYFVKLYSVWSPYHFSGQTVGLTLLYARRAGVPVDPRERRVLSGFVFGTFAWMIARTETGAGGFVYYGVRYPSLGLPPWVPELLAAWVCACGAAILLRAALGWARTGRAVPPIVLLPAATQLVWFVLGRDLPNFTEFVPLFHALQYLLVAWALQLKERLDETGRGPSPAFVTVESARWLAANVAGGALLFYVLPRLAAAFGQPLALATGVVFAAVQIHHFFVDGVIWKLKNERVASPLLVRWRDLRGPAPAAAR